MKNSFLFPILTFCLLFFSCKKDPINNNSGNDDQQLKQGLIAYYPFNAGAKDESGNGYDLSVTGAVLTDNRFGEKQKAYSFNGATDYMIIPKIAKADSLREFTISVWVNLQELGHTTILSLSPDSPRIASSYLGFDNSSRGYLTWHQIITQYDPWYSNAVMIRDTITNPLNKWNHIVLVQRYIGNLTASRYEYSDYYNGMKSRITFNSTQDVTATSFNGGGTIGVNNTTGNYNYNFDFYKGSIDDIRIYNRALSDVEVSQLYYLHE